MRTSWKILSFLAIGAPGLLSATGALAQEEFSWSGFYVGLDGGYGWTEPDAVSFSTDDFAPGNIGDSVAPSRGTIGNLDAQSWFAGGQVGINGQKGHIVMGIEGDMQGADFHDTQAGVFTNPDGFYNPIDGNASLDINWFGTVRGRLGLAMNRFMVYGTGGLAFADVDYQLSAIEGGGSPLYQTQLRADQVEGGFAVGGGMEMGITRNLSIKGEYQFIDLGEVEDSSPVTFIAGGAPTGETAHTQFDVQFHTVRIGGNYRFGSAP